MRPLSKSTKQSLEQAVSQYELSGTPESYEYLRGRGISPASIESFRLGYVKEPISEEHEPYRGCLAIPSLGPGGVYGLRFRRLGGDGPKYLGLSGTPTRLFNIRDIHSAGDTICVTEGEIDSIILSQCGLKSVGVSGANSWKKHHARMLAGFQTVYIFGDGDKAGNDFAASVLTQVAHGQRIRLPTGCDVNDLYLTHGQDGLLKLMEEM